MCGNGPPTVGVRTRKKTVARGPGISRWGRQKVIKGGSCLCQDSWCNRYRVAAQTFNEPDASTAHMGFRLVWSAVA
ncbi:SUMF1/EgtB/PvdO family nonheme iron enzyme [Paracoccus methylovorus]